MEPLNILSSGITMLAKQNHYILVCTLVNVYSLWFPDISSKLEAFLRVDSVAEGSPSSQAVRNIVYLFPSRGISM